MVINESTEEIASQDPQLGPTTSKRTAKTTVVAKDQETVVIGGIMQERTIESIGKVPILGDIPLLGYLFRETTRRKVKVNLLLFLTPYIIRDASDFRRIFEKKMAERQRFVEEFYGQVPGYDVPIDFGRKPGPLAKMNQIVMREELKVENGGPGLPGEQIFRPGQLGPGAPRQRSGEAPSSPADIGRDLLQQGQPAPTAPAPAPAGPLGPGVTGTPAPPAAPGAPPSGSPAPGTAAPPPGSVQQAPLPEQTPPAPAQATPPPSPEERLQVQPR
jgi:general secretion pathway protein D